MPPKTYIWEPEPIFDPNHGWVFIEYQAPGDRSNRNPKKKPLAPWQLDNYGQPLPGSSPTVDLKTSAERHDATSRTDPRTLVKGMEGLGLHQKGIDSNSHEDTSPDEHLLAQSPPNYHHSLQDQGNSYGAQGQSYVGPSDTVLQSSGKGKGRATRSGSSKEGGQSSRHSSNHHRRSSHKRPSSSKTSNVDPDEGSQLQEQHEFPFPSFSQEAALPYTTGGDLGYPYSTPGLQTSSSYGLPPVLETEPLPTDYGVDDTLTEEGRYQQYGSKTGSASHSYTTAATGVQSSMRTVPRGPSSSSKRYGNNNQSSYQTHHAKEFTLGKVFKVRWCEPKGNQGYQRLTGINGSRLTENKQIPTQSESSWFWAGYRRFIVVRAFDSHCFAVPIYTYGNQGCLKRGCKPEYHGIVHDAKKEPEQLPGEPLLGFQPIRIKMRNNDSLLPESRANYFGSTTVQYNQDVVFVGEVVKEDLNTLDMAVKMSYAGN